jgi:DNA-binding MarR family transcriptional regulator
MPNSGLKTEHHQASANKIQQIGLILDHLLDAIGGDPSNSLARLITLVDIDAHPGTTQAEIMNRVNLDKSTINRHIQSLTDYCCIDRRPGVQDARVIHMSTIGFSRKNISLALDYFDGSHKNLQNFLTGLINMFTAAKPTIRDAKILVSAAQVQGATKQEILSQASFAPSTTNARALESLVEQGLIDKG